MEVLSSSIESPIIQAFQPQNRGEIFSMLLDLLRPKQNSLGIDLGSGTGFIANTIEKACGCVILCLNNDPEEVKKHIKKYPETPINNVDLNALSLNATYDFIYGLESLGYVRKERLSHFFEKATKSLKPGAPLLLKHFTCIGDTAAYDLCYKNSGYRPYTEAEIQEALPAHVEIEKIYLNFAVTVPPKTLLNGWSERDYKETVSKDFLPILFLIRGG